ncbi:MAG: tyrosine-type recombinase/integrase, partial [Opitutales bacterium]
RGQIRAAFQILEGTGISIVRAAEMAAKQLSASGTDKEASMVIFEFLEAKERQGRAERTRYSLKNRLKHFTKRGRITTLRQFTPEACADYIYRGEPNQQRNNYAALNNFANFCVRRGYIQTNPLLRIEKPGAPRREHKATLSAKEAEAFLRELEAHHPAYVTFYAALLFAFLRPSEAEALTKQDFQRGRVRVIGGKMRGRKRRFVPIRKGLQSYLDAYGWQVPTAFWQRECRSRCPVPWVNDICRHTGISFRLAESGDEKKTSQEAGNSVETMYAYYTVPKGAAEAKRFWGIGPLKPSGKANRDTGEY